MANVSELVLQVPIEECQRARDAQRANDVNFSDAYWLPQLPDDAKDTVYERALAAEQMFSRDLTKAGYKIGTAETDDELLEKSGAGAVLTADHATHRMRLEEGKTERIEQTADYGTGALGLLLHEDTNAHFLAPLGRQTRDANYDLEHPLKEALGNVLKRKNIEAHLSIHGIYLARVRSIADMRGYSIILGIGDNPTDETMDAVDKAIDIAKKYDLKIGVNQPVLQFASDGFTPKKTSEGSAATITFAARKPGTSRSFSQALAEQEKLPLVSMQVEINDALRLLPTDYSRNPGEKSQRMGVYLGYLFTKELVDELVTPTAILSTTVL